MKTRSVGPEFIWQTFVRHNYAYTIYNIHMKNIRIHSHLVVYINWKKKNNDTVTKLMPQVTMTDKS